MSPGRQWRQMHSCRRDQTFSFSLFLPCSTLLRFNCLPLTAGLTLSSLAPRAVACFKTTGAAAPVSLSTTTRNSKTLPQSVARLGTARRRRPQFYNQQAKGREQKRDLHTKFKRENPLLAWAEWSRNRMTLARARAGDQHNLLKCFGSLRHLAGPNCVMQLRALCCCFASLCVCLSVCLSVVSVSLLRCLCAALTTPNLPPSSAALRRRAKARGQRGP